MADIIFPLQFKRQYSGSLDPDLVFDTISDKNDYLSSPRRYAGQIVSCLEEEGRAFILNNSLDEWISVSTDINVISGDGIDIDADGEGNFTVSISGGLQEVYNNGNTIIHDGVHDIELFGNSGDGLSVDDAGNVILDNEFYVVNGFYSGDYSAPLNTIDRLAYFYTETVPGQIFPTSSISSTFASSFSANVIGVNNIESITHNVNLRQTFNGDILSYPTSGEKIFNDFEVYNNDSGSLLIDNIKYSSLSRESNKSYTNVFKLFDDAVEIEPGEYDFDVILGDYGRRLIDTTHYRNWGDNRTFASGGGNVNNLRVDPFDSAFSEGVYNCGAMGSNNRGLGVYGNGVGQLSTFTVQVWVPPSGEFTLSCDIVATWNRFAASENLRYATYKINLSGASGSVDTYVSNTNITPALARTWITPESAPLDAIFQVNHTWTSATPGLQTLSFEYNGTSPAVNPYGLPTTQHRNITIAIYNLVTNSQFPLGLTPTYKGFQTPNVYISSLDGNSEGNILTFDNESRIIDTGISVEDITGGFTPLAGDGITITPSGDDYIFSVDDYISSTEVAEISGNLQTQINEIEQEQTIVVGVSGISVTEDPEHTWIVSGEELDGRISELENTIGTLLQGEVECISGSYVYTIGHPTVDLGSSFPQVSLSVPTSASDLYVQGITNRTQNSFDVVLSDAPTISGYKIYWSMNVGQNALVVKTYNAGFIEVENGDSISLNAAEYDNFEINALGHGEFTMSDPTHMENGQSINVKIQNVDGTMDIDWVGNFKFQNGDAPLLSQSPEAEDIFTILKLSNTFYVSYILNFID